MTDQSKKERKLPYDTPLERRLKDIVFSFQDFINNQVAASFLLITSTLVALVWVSANIHADIYEKFIHLKIGFVLDSFVFTRPLKFWTNDVLLTLFFFFVGLEIKREFLVGELTNPKTALLISISAIGGMAVPAIIYAIFTINTAAQHGWGIPMATDTAFALGLATCFKSRLSKGAISFVAALAIIDDIGAILIIAIFYTGTINYYMLAVTLVLLLFLLTLNYAGFRNPLPYVLVGFFMWATLEAAGIHGTIAGILAAFCVPARPQREPGQFIERIESLVSYFKKRKEQKSYILEDNEQHKTLEGIREVTREATTPLQRWEYKLELPIVLFILPLFALVNAGIPISSHLIHHVFTSPVSLGIMTALVIGKPLGILLFMQLALSTKVGELGNGTTFKHIAGVAFLTGIGFTMSLFISNLSFTNSDFTLTSKGGILFGSLISACLGITYLLSLRKHNR